MLCGVGFTMSLFIGGLAFNDPQMISAVKVGVLSGSAFSAVVGFAVLWFADPRRGATQSSVPAQEKSETF